MEMGDEPVLSAAAGIVVLIALATAALSYMRTYNALVELARQNKSNGWVGRGPYRLLYGDKPRPIYSNWWVGNAILGLGGLGISGEGYRALLRAARVQLLACFVLFMILVAGLGWSTRGSMDQALLARVNAEYEALLARGDIGEHARPKMLNTYVGDGAALVSQGGSRTIVLPQGPHMAPPPDAH